MKIMRLWKKNKGFTLVELIIAVAILAIIITPLVGNFVQSAKMNQKARQNLDGMNMAQDIMEGMASFTGEQIINMFETDETLSGKILAASASYEKHGDADSSWTRKYSVDPNPGVSANNTPQYADMRYYDSSHRVSKRSIPVDDYYLYIDGWSMGGDKYNFDIHLKSIIKNKKAEAATIDRTYDAVYTAPDSYSSSITDPISGFTTKNPTTVASDYIGKIKRQIIVEIKVDDKGTPSTTDDEYPIMLTDQFKAFSITGLTDDTFSVTSSTNVFSNSTGKKPENLYIFYPASVDATGSCASEEFYIRNKTNNYVNVFIIRQKSPIVGTVNSNHSAKVLLSDEGDDGKQHLYLITNARFDLDHTAEENIRKVKGDGSPNDDEYLVNMYGVMDLSLGHKVLPASLISYYNYARCEIKYRRGTWPGAPGAEAAPEATYASSLLVNDAEDVTNHIPAYNDVVSDGIMKRDSAAAYDVEITVYKQNKKDPSIKKQVAKYSGALAN